MTSTAPRPMATPDLAGLLSRPPRPVTAATPHREPDQATDGEPVPSEDSDTQPTTPETEPDSPQPETPPAGSGGPKRVRRTRPPPSSPEPGAHTVAPSGRQYLRSIALYLPRSMHRALGEHADARGTTRTAVILNAVNQTHDQLGARLASEDTGCGGGDLFDIPQEKVAKEPSVQTTIRVTDRQLHAIDTLVTALETNRSRLITTALTLYLA